MKQIEDKLSDYFVAEWHCALASDYGQSIKTNNFVSENNFCNRSTFAFSVCKLDTVLKQLNSVELLMLPQTISEIKNLYFSDE